MTQAENGQVLPLEQALTLTDNQGKPLKWKKDEHTDTYSAEETESDFSTYNYSLKPQAQNAIVTVTKDRKSEKEIAKAKAKINKAEVQKEEPTTRAATPKEEKEVKKYQSAATR